MNSDSGVVTSTWGGCSAACAPLARRRVAGADRGPDPRRRVAELGRERPQLRQRLLEVAADVVRQRLQGRHVEDAGPVGQLAADRDRLGDEPIERPAGRRPASFRSPSGRCRARPCRRRSAARPAPARGSAPRTFARARWRRPGETFVQYLAREAQAGSPFLLTPDLVCLRYARQTPQVFRSHPRPNGKGPAHGQDHRHRPRHHQLCRRDHGGEGPEGHRRTRRAGG